MATSAQCRILPRAADVTGCARLDEVRHQCSHATLHYTDGSQYGISKNFVAILIAIAWRHTSYNLVCCMSPD
jgi:hypothetical protein